MLKCKLKDPFMNYVPGQDSLVVSTSASYALGHEFASQLCHTKDHYKMVQTAYLLGMQALG